MAEEGRDYIITGELPRTEIERWNANIKAIKVMQDLEKSGRRATQEEQGVLANYSGFGDSGFEDAFRSGGARNPAWQRRREELREIVGEDAYRDFAKLERSRLNAHYTTAPVINSMWKGLTDMGADKLERPKVLEPSAGRAADRYARQVNNMNREDAEEAIDVLTGILEEVGTREEKARMENVLAPSTEPEGPKSYEESRDLSGPMGQHSRR